MLVILVPLKEHFTVLTQTLSLALTVFFVPKPKNFNPNHNNLHFTNVTQKVTFLLENIMLLSFITDKVQTSCGEDDLHDVNNMQ